MSNQENGYQDPKNTATEFSEPEQLSPVDREIQQVFSRPVRRNFRSTSINAFPDQINGIVVGELFNVVDEVGVVEDLRRLAAVADHGRERTRQEGNQKMRLI